MGHCEGLVITLQSLLSRVLSILLTPILALITTLSASNTVGCSCAHLRLQGASAHRNEERNRRLKKKTYNLSAEKKESKESGTMRNIHANTYIHRRIDRYIFTLDR